MITHLNNEFERLEPLHSILMRYRITNKLTQVQMATLLECTQPQYSRWEHGHRPSKLREFNIRNIIK